jgi:hypothetical protein
MTNRYRFSHIIAKEGRFVSAVFSNSAGNEIIKDAKSFFTLVPSKKAIPSISHKEVTRAAAAFVMQGLNV